MRLFQKTLYLFFTIIFLLSVSTTVFITQAINTKQSIEASSELAREAMTVYDNFNYWKFLLWRYINLLAEDVQLQSLVVPLDKVSATNVNGFDQNLISVIQQTASRAGVDYTVIKRESDGSQLLLPVETLDQPYLDVDVFQNKKEHPYIEIIKLHNTLYFTGIVRLGSQVSGSAIDVFLIKMIDHNLLQKLISNQRIKVVVASADGTIDGTIPVDNIPLHLLNGEIENAYRTIKHIEIDGQNYRAIIQQSGSVMVGGNSEMLTLAVFLTLSDYDQQVTHVNQAILTISLIAAVFTILLSFIFSKHLSSPIHKVVQAMQKIKEGDYQVSIPFYRRGEIGELLDGFNEMTAQLAVDKQTREKHLHQIMQLKSYNENIIDAMPEGLVVVSGDLIVEKINEACLQIFSLTEDEITGVSLDTLPLDMIDETLVSKIRSVLLTGNVPVDEIQRMVGEKSFDVKLYPLFGEGDIHCIMVIEDISARIAYKQKMFQAERLASISLISAGMAHEINNPLSSILSNTQNLIRVESDPQNVETLLLIELETKRIARIVRGLLDFSNTDGNATVGALVNETIGEITRLIGYSIQKEHKIVITTNFDESCPLVAISTDELKQVVLNLVKNSIQALKIAGTVSVTTRYLHESHRVEVSVSDDGEGISPERIRLIFDPFYTTKSGDIGIGLGLSIVYGIIKKYKGDVNVTSTVGKGTLIAFQLPIK